MSTYLQAIIDPVVSEEEAKKLSKVILNWLIKEKIIKNELKHCVLHSKNFGYIPGKNFLKATDLDEDPLSANLNYKSFSKELINGLEVITKRHMTYDYGRRMDEILCPECNMSREPDKVWGNAITEWLEYKGLGLILCPHCNNESSVIKWKHIEEVGYGVLTFNFWDWAPLSSDFIEEFSKKLNHKLIFISTKI